MELAVEDAVELAEMLDFVRGWIGADPEEMAASLRRFVGADGYDLAELRRDLARFVFLLGGGEELFDAEAV
ncbi:hypothetical protein [Catenulispora subtropica]|uniref:CdiI immunity protein domain-containing protein n=1 Tax=Catenulispora subtropica TaxID=450798 RepID=A0ABP5CFY5_9ACTN